MQLKIRSKKVVINFFIYKKNNINVFIKFWCDKCASDSIKTNIKQILPIGFFRKYYEKHRMLSQLLLLRGTGVH